MNIKAERIEQLIQVVNRNLLLIYSGQKHGTTPIDTHRLHRVDAAIFDGDKFAFEMVHFVKSSRDEGDGSITALWDRNFTKGLETLLVECAMVKDNIERDCFVSRVYCWFTEKLTERRDLPRQVMGKQDIKERVNVEAQEHRGKSLFMLFIEEPAYTRNGIAFALYERVEKSLY